MKKRLQYFCKSFRINFDELEIYDKDFIFGVLGVLVEYLSGLLMMFFIYDFVEDINGWSLDQVLFFYGLNLVGYSLWSCFFINTITLPYYIQRGEFDRFLVRPESPLFQIMMDSFDDDSWGELVTGLIILCYSWIRLRIPPIYFLALPIIVVSGCLIYLGISIILSTFSFFTIAQADVANITMEVKEFAKYPLTIYPKVLQIIFTVVFPIGIVAFIPGMVLFRQIPWQLLLVIPLVAVVFFILSTRVWYLGLKHYGGTGT